jgi:hypothetical protein
MKYTHVLSIKIWSDKSNLYTNYGNILEIVKNTIIDVVQTQELLHRGKRETVSLLWKKIAWPLNETELHSGNIVTYAPGMDDFLIFEHVKKMIEEVSESVCLNKKFDSDYKIVFSLVKPVCERSYDVEFTDL